MKARDISEILENFEKLPDSAVVPDRVAALMTGKSRRTLRRDPTGAVSVTSQIRGRTVKSIRAMLRAMRESA